jgi:uncharacterized coiled-coil protein SlyX
MSDIPDVTQRLDDLEAHVTHQDSIIQDLNEITLQQWNEIKALNEKLDFLKDKIQASEGESGVDSTPEPPPPHY